MSKLERQGDGNRVELEQMSTAELEELLRPGFVLPVEVHKDAAVLRRPPQAASSSPAAVVARRACGGAGLFAAVRLGGGCSGRPGSVAASGPVDG